MLFSHTGFKVDYVTNPHGIIAGTNTTNSFQLGFQTGYKGQYFNLVYGSDGFGFKDVLYLDYTGGFDVIDSFYLGINAAYSNSNDADAGYKGVALYLQKSFSKTFSLGLRPEFFTTTSTSKNTNQSAYTLSLNKKLSENLKIITELRHDTSKDVTFFGRNNLSGATLAAIYNF